MAPPSSSESSNSPPAARSSSVDLFCDEDPQVVCYDRRTLEERVDALAILRDKEVLEGLKLPEEYLSVPVLEPMTRRNIIAKMISYTESLELSDEDLFLAVNHLDYYLAAKRRFEADDEQHLPLACFFAGNKEIDDLWEKMFAEEVYGSIKETRSTDDEQHLPLACFLAGNKEIDEVRVRVIAKEVVSSIKGTRPTAIDALKMITEEDKLASYLLKLSLAEHGFLRFLPSMIAAVAVFVANMLRKNTKPKVLSIVTSSEYKMPELKKCTDLMFTMLANNEVATANIETIIS